MIIDWTKDIKNPFGLKPCPFCGANAEMKVEPHIPASKGYDYTPRCTVTGCCGRSTKKYTNEKQAIYRWNRRSDEQERPKGRWIKETQPLTWEEVDVATCSVCGESWFLGEDEDCLFEEIAEMWDFCPNCGADMRESE